MRLIDADRLIKIVRDAIGEDSDGSKTAVFSANDIIFIIENAATAYDVDKVVERLKKEKKRAFELCLAINDRAQRLQYIIKEQTMALAIEIVKGGGLDGN